MRVRFTPLLIGAVALSMPLSALAQAEDQEILPEWEDAGVTESGAYESPQFGYEVTWANDWLIDESFDIDAVQSNADTGDVLYLGIDGEDLSASVAGSAIDDWAFEDEEAPQEEWLDILASPGAAGEADPYEVLYADVVDDVAINVTYTNAYTTDASNQVVYRTLQLVDGGDGVGIFLLFVPLDGFEDAYDALEDIEIDGVPVGGALSSGDIDEIVTAAEEIDDGADDTTDDGEEDTTDDPADDGDDPVGGDYIDTVAEDVSTRQAELERLYEISESSNPTDAELGEFITIVEGWEDAAAIAADLEPDAEFEDLHATYLDYVTALEDANTAFNDFLATEEDSPEEEEAWESFIENVELASDLSEDLIADIEDAGGEIEGVDPAEATPDVDDDGSDDDTTDDDGTDDDGDDSDDEFDPGFLSLERAA